MFYFPKTCICLHGEVFDNFGLSEDKWPLKKTEISTLEKKLGSAGTRHRCGVPLKASVPNQKGIDSYKSII